MIETEVRGSRNKAYIYIYIYIYTNASKSLGKLNKFNMGRT